MSRAPQLPRDRSPPPRGRPAFRRATVAEARYQRERDLPSLLKLWPDEVGRLDAGDGDWLVRRLECALRAERQRGRAGHWTYDLTRHAGLMRALKCERARRLASSLADFGAAASKQARD